MMSPGGKLRATMCHPTKKINNVQISIGLSVFVANEYKQIAIRLLSTIHNIQSTIRWAIMNVILNYLLLPSKHSWVTNLSLYKHWLNPSLFFKRKNSIIFLKMGFNQQCNIIGRTLDHWTWDRGFESSRWSTPVADVIKLFYVIYKF